MITEPLKMTCTVCKASWTDNSLKPSHRKFDLRDRMRVPAPCGHGYAFVVRFYDANEDTWYYHQLEFIKK
jgi:hypothetical protein